LGLAAVLFCLYAWHAHYATNPLIKSDLLRFRTFRVSVFGNLISRLGFGGIPFLVPLLLQIGLGYSAQLSGLLWAPVAIGVMVTRLFSVKLLRFIGYRRALILNTCCSGLLIWSFMGINAHTPIYIICLLTFGYGIFLSLQYSAMNALAYAELSADDFSAATSIMSTLQQVAQSFGVAVAAVLIHLFLFLFSSNLTLTVGTFHHAFFVIGALTLLSMFIFMQLKVEDGQKLLGG
ncbi:MAG: hypothetical protein Q8L68_04165, partial [Methylococcales bacterium]|nr:hypothetical protein [Methylococcales bacterium]